MLFKMWKTTYFLVLNRTINVIRSAGYRNSPKLTDKTSNHQELTTNVAKSNPDTFGNYSEIASKFDITKDDPEDIKEKMRQKQMDRQSPAFYIDSIKSHLNNHNVT